MSRVKRSVHARKKRRATLEMAKGFRGDASVITARPRRPCSRPTSTATAIAVTASATSAACGSPGSTRPRGSTACPTRSSCTASQLAGVELDRKVLADIAVHDADTFRRFADRAREALAAG
jgi:large subunit ribosomal protein L20